MASIRSPLLLRACNPRPGVACSQSLPPRWGLHTTALSSSRTRDTSYSFQTTLLPLQASSACKKFLKLATCSPHTYLCSRNTSVLTNSYKRHRYFSSVTNVSDVTSSSIGSSVPESKVAVDEKSERIIVAYSKRLLKIPWVWLRDHCRSDRYYNWATNQKNIDGDLLQRNLHPKDVGLSHDGVLSVEWHDGHKSKFTLKWLEENFYSGQVDSVPVKRCLWDRATVQSSLPTVQYQEHMSSAEGLKTTLSNLVTYGFCLVNGAPSSIDGTQEVVERLTFVLPTLFGGMWSFTSDTSRSDTAYCSHGLGAHTDMTYYDTPAGIQVFQCLKHDGNGGETLLVDGFRAVEELRVTNPEQFDLLSDLVIPHQYIEPPGEHSPGYHLYSLGSVIRLHPASREVLHLRFNPYDRAPLNTVPPELIQDYYKAYHTLSRIIAKEEGNLWVKLTPGTVLLIDNWRVMHGRSAFGGERVMCGCYLPRDEWVSKAKMFGLV